MLGGLLQTRKASGSVTSTSSSTPPLSRASSTSTSYSDSDGGNLENVALMPLTSHGDDRHVRASERSLRQRAPASSSTNSSPRDEDDSPPSQDIDESKGGTTSSPSVLRSVLGASPFLMGPHVFSTSEFSQPSRARKESGDGDDLLHKGLDRGSSPSKIGVKYRRSVPQSSLMASSSTSFSDVDIENGGAVDEISPLPPTRRKYAFHLRSRENIIIQILMEAKMLQTHLLFVIFATWFQFFHSAVTNVAYWQHAQLNAANRVPLRDIAFDMLPPLDGELWIVSEYILLVILGVALSCIISNLVVRWNAPHGRPIFTMQIVRRLGMTWIVCQSLRMISFLVTTLPGASRQCRYAVPEGLTSEEMLNGPAPEAGNPSGWAPPSELNDVLFRVDASNGCGDLMFSSHTIYTMTFVCVVFRYFNFRWLKAIMALGQISIVPFILAARKHYTVDVFTALYVTPLVFEILWVYFPDRDTSVDLAKHYGIRFYLAQEGHDAFSYVVSVYGREFFVDPEQLPVDLSQGHQNAKGLALPYGKGGESSRSTSSIV